MSELLLVKDFMAQAPTFVAPSDTLEYAEQQMLARGFRHLPVVLDGRVVGLISLSDIHMVVAFLALDAAETELGSYMSKDVAEVAPTATLKAVAEKMTAAQVGSVVVTDGERLVGLFTATDAVRALAEVLP